jgi:hypothetical protein
VKNRIFGAHSKIEIYLSSRSLRVDDYQATPTLLQFLESQAGNLVRTPTTRLGLIDYLHPLKRLKQALHVWYNLLLFGDLQRAAFGIFEFP